MLFSFLLVCGCGIFSLALRSFDFPLFRWLGAFGVLSTSFLTGWLLGGEVWLGVLFALSWFFAPWVEIVFRARILESSENARLAVRTPPHSEDFPTLLTITEELESEGCEYVSDVGWKNNTVSHFYRLFYHPQDRIQIALSFIEYHSFSIYYITFTSYASDSKMQYTSSNYPFSYVMKPAKNCKTYRLKGDFVFTDMMEEHTAFLSSYHVTKEQLQVLKPTDFVKNIEQSFFEQVQYNLQTGILEKKKDSGIHYSWKGRLYLWWHCGLDLIR